MQVTTKFLDNQEKTEVKTLPKLNPKEQKMFRYLLKSFVYQKIPFGFYKPISAKHFLKNYGSRYWQPLGSLEQKGYIDINHFYRFTEIDGKKGTCKSYKINPCVFAQRFRFSDLQSEPSKRTSNRLLIKTAANLRQMVCTIPFEQIQSTVSNLVTDDYINDRYKDVNEIEDGIYFFVLDGSLSSCPLPKDKILNLAKNKRLDALFCNKNRLFYLGDQDTIKAQKKDYVQASFTYMLDMFATGRQTDTIDRSDTNKRLTTLFTIFANDLLKYLSFCGQDFKQFDISNSQFCILANLIQGFYNCNILGLFCPLNSQFETLKDYYPSFANCFNLLLDADGNLLQDVQDFMTTATDGILYEKISQTCSLSRPLTKQAMFVVAFSQPQYNPKIKEKVKEQFPNIINFIDSVKRTLPKKDKVCFAVMLQTIESFICIDNVLTTLYKHKVNALTRHDSFAIPSNQKELAETIIQSELKRLLPYGFNLKATWNYDKQ